MGAEVEAFLTAEEEQEIVEAIRQAERTTSGEIRVHIEPHTDKDVVIRAAEVFHWLKMDTTAQRNGVLIYVAVKDHTFSIYGDIGINKVVADNFWESTRTIIQTHFRNGHFVKGFVEGILKAGEQLQTHFPWDHSDKNELPDEISKG